LAGRGKALGSSRRAQGGAAGTVSGQGDAEVAHSRAGGGTTRTQATMANPLRSPGSPQAGRPHAPSARGAGPWRRRSRTAGGCGCRRP